MFVIRKEGKKYGSKTFRTYERARQYVRKLMRVNKEKFAAAFTDAKRTNAAIGWFGFSISRV
jgi:hypothetical protein